MGGKRAKARKRNVAAIRRVYANLGALQAELDENLSVYYVTSGGYVERALDFDDPAMVFRGPKGVGKSAVLKMVEIQSRNNGPTIVRITPDDLAFSALANVKVDSPLLESAVNNQWLFKSLWDYVLSVRLLSKEYRYKQSKFERILNIFGSEEQKLARRLLSMSFSDDGAAEPTLTNMLLSIVNEIEVSLEYEGAKGSARAGLDAPQGTSTKHLSVLSTVNRVARSLPKLLEDRYYVLIDDLDLHWTNQPTQNALIAALFTSMAKLRNPDSVKFAVAIREDIYQHLPVEDKDKSRDWICDVAWDYPSLKEMLERRMEVLHGIKPEQLWSDLLPANAFDSMVGHSRGRPRELIRLLALGFDEACRSQHHTVAEEDLSSALRRFSEEKIEDIGQENRTVLPGLAWVIGHFRGMKQEFSLEELSLICTQMALELMEDRSIQAYSWAGTFDGKPKELARILVSLEVLRVKTTRTAPPQPDLGASLLDRLDHPWFSIHPLYRPALGVLGT